MSLFFQLGIGSVMIALTVMIHAVTLDFILKATPRIEHAVTKIFAKGWRPVVASLVVLGVFVSHVVHIWLWAALYHVTEAAAFTSFSEVLYFSSVTYTTLGYGDIVLEPGYRVLSGI